MKWIVMKFVGFWFWTIFGFIIIVGLIVGYMNTPVGMDKLYSNNEKIILDKLKKSQIY